MRPQASEGEAQHGYYFAGLDVSVKETSDLHYIAVGIVLVVSAGLGVLVASQIVVVLGYTG